MNTKKAVSMTYGNIWPLPATTVMVSCIGKSNVPNIITVGACGIARWNTGILAKRSVIGCVRS